MTEPNFTSEKKLLLAYVKSHLLHKDIKTLSKLNDYWLETYGSQLENSINRYGLEKTKKQIEKSTKMIQSIEKQTALNHKKLKKCAFCGKPTTRILDDILTCSKCDYNREKVRFFEKSNIKGKFEIDAEVKCKDGDLVWNGAIVKLYSEGADVYLY